METRINRRRAGGILAAVAGSIATPALRAQTTPGAYPSRPVRVVVAAAPGGGLDLGARPMFAKLQERMGGAFVIENRGGSTVALDTVARSAPDGYTLLVAANTNFFAAEQIIKVNYDVRTKFVPVAMLNRSPLVVMVNNDLPVKNVAELIAYAKANPKVLNYAFVAGGSVSQLAGELLKLQAGIHMEGIGFKGIGPAYIEQMAGRVHVTFGSMGSAMELLRSNKLRAIAVTSAERSRLLPDVPAVRETLPRYDVFDSSTSVYAVEGTPRAIVTTLNREINRVLMTRELHATYITQGSEPAPGTPEALGKALIAGLDSARKVIKLANIRAD